MAMTEAELKAAAVASANKYGVPVDMFLWQIGKESAWNPNAQNPKSTAGGIAQFVDGTADMFKINKWDPIQALDAAAKYDAQLYAKEGTWKAALTRYGTLHGADQQTLNEFDQVLGGGAVEEQGIMSKIADGAKKVWDGSAFGLYSDTFKNLTGTGTPSGAWDFQKMASTGVFIVLGLIVIAIAVLSNDSVRKAAKTAATKGIA